MSTKNPYLIVTPRVQGLLMYMRWILKRNLSPLLDEAHIDVQLLDIHAPPDTRLSCIDGPVHWAQCLDTPDLQRRMYAAFEESCEELKQKMREQRMLADLCDEDLASWCFAIREVCNPGLTLWEHLSIWALYDIFMEFIKFPDGTRIKEMPKKNRFQAHQSLAFELQKAYAFYTLSGMWKGSDCASLREAPKTLSKIEYAFLDHNYEDASGALYALLFTLLRVLKRPTDHLGLCATLGVMDSLSLTDKKALVSWIEPHLRVQKTLLMGLSYAYRRRATAWVIGLVDRYVHSTEEEPKERGVGELMRGWWSLGPNIRSSPYINAVLPYWVRVLGRDQLDERMCQYLHQVVLPVPMDKAHVHWGHLFSMASDMGIGRLIKVNSSWRALAWEQVSFVHLHSEQTAHSTARLGHVYHMLTFAWDRAEWKELVPRLLALLVLDKEGGRPLKPGEVLAHEWLLAQLEQIHLQNCVSGTGVCLNSSSGTQEGVRTL